MFICPFCWSKFDKIGTEILYWNLVVQSGLNIYRHFTWKSKWTLMLVWLNIASTRPQTTLKESNKYCGQIFCGVK
jgi:hypothetical protein